MMKVRSEGHRSASGGARAVFTAALLASLVALAPRPADARRHSNDSRDRRARAERRQREQRERAQRERDRRRAQANARRGRRGPFAYIGAADRQRGKRRH